MVPAQGVTGKPRRWSSAIMSLILSVVYRTVQHSWHPRNGKAKRRLLGLLREARSGLG